MYFITCLFSLLIWMIFPPAPSAAPTSVSVSEVTSSSITVQWGAVDCIHRNGDITGYSVRYGVQGNGSTQTVSVSGGGATMTTMSGLTASTTYSIEVAAVNSAGTGVYSDPMTAETPESKCAYLHVLWNEMNIYLICSHYRCVPQSEWRQHPQPWLCGDQ